MPVSLAILALVALFMIIAAPAFFVVARPRVATAVIPIYVVLFMGLAIYHVGYSWSGNADPSKSPTSMAGRAGGSSSLCEQALDQLDQAGVILDRSDPLRVVVNQEFWAQLPQNAKDGLIACLQLQRPENRSEEPVEIVEGNGQAGNSGPESESVTR